MAAKKRKATRKRATTRELAPQVPVNWPDIQRFCVAFASKDSPTYGRGAAAMQATFPDLKYESARRQSFRWRARDDVHEEIERIRASEFTAGGVDAASWAAAMYEQGRALISRGRPGDAAAGVRMVGYAGEAMGYRKKLVEDMTPLERKTGAPHLTGGELAAHLIAQMEQMKRLREPVPMPQVEEIEAVEVKPKGDWERAGRPPLKGLITAGPMPCVVCQSEDTIECGDRQYRCMEHTRAWAQSQLPNGDPETGRGAPVLGAVEVHTPAGVGPDALAPQRLGSEGDPPPAVVP